MDSKKFSIIAPLFVLISAVLWGTVGFYTKYLYSIGVSAYQVSFLRCAVSAVILIPLVIIFNDNKMRLKKKSDLLYFFIAGTVGLGMMYTAFFMTIQTSTLAIGTIMVYIGPVFVLVMAYFIFKEKITKRKIISIILSIEGVIIMSGLLGGAEVILTFKGFSIGLLSGVGYAFYNIGSRLCIDKGYDTFTVNAYTFAFASIAILPFSPVHEIAQIVIIHPKAILAILGMVVLSTLIAYTFYIVALKHIEVGRATLISFADPMTATLIGLIFFNEAITANAIISIFLIFISLIFANFEKSLISTIKEKNRKNPE